ncbi:MAG: peptidase M42 [Erysipelotrichaceae bacterium]|nr:peptidase M42 [Erysipelotrichaceae bacterium]
MRFKASSRLLSCMKTLINTPSVVGYYPQIHPVMEEMIAPTGYRAEYDNRRTLYVKIPGKSSGRVRMLGAHLDTIGMSVRHIDDNGWLQIRNLGGINLHSLEGENVLVHTRFNGDFTGTVICKSHSVHVYEDARSLEREPVNMRIVLDEEISCRDDAVSLGVRPGDLISVEPRYTETQSGFIKSRHIDDKSSAAILIECLHLLKENRLQPAYDTWLSFPIYEEIGMGGSYVPDEVDEFVALDIGLIGENQEGNEHMVSIGAADNIAPYDWELTNFLIQLAEKNGIRHCVDSFYRYGSDATAAVRAGNNVVPAVFGVACLSSHGYERCHIQGIEETLNLAMAYILTPDAE